MESILTVETILPLVIMLIGVATALLRFTSAAIGLATAVVSLIQTVRDRSRKK